MASTGGKGGVEEVHEEFFTDTALIFLAADQIFGKNGVNQQKGNGKGGATRSKGDPEGFVHPTKVQYLENKRINKEKREKERREKEKREEELESCEKCQWKHRHPGLSCAKAWELRTLLEECSVAPKEVIKGGSRFD